MRPEAADANAPAGSLSDQARVPHVIASSPAAEIVAENLLQIHGLVSFALAEAFFFALCSNLYAQSSKNRG